MLTNLQSLGILNLNNFSYPLSYRNSTDTQILKNKLRIDIGAMCAINKSIVSRLRWNNEYRLYGLV